MALVDGFNGNRIQADHQQYSGSNYQAVGPFVNDCAVIGGFVAAAPDTDAREDGDELEGLASARTWRPGAGCVGYWRNLWGPGEPLLPVRDTGWR